MKTAASALIKIIHLLSPETCAWVTILLENPNHTIFLSGWNGQTYPSRKSQESEGGGFRFSG